MLDEFVNCRPDCVDDPSRFAEEALGLAPTAQQREFFAALAGPERTLGADDLEAAVLSRRNGRRAFRRLDDDEVAGLLAAG